MSWLEGIRIAFRVLRNNPMRSMLTMLGIIIGVGAVITMVAIGAGAQQNVSEQIRSLGANLLMVVPGAAREGGARLKAGTRHTLTESDAAAIRRDIPRVDVSSPSIRGAAHVVNRAKNWRTVINGTIPSYFQAREWPIAEGRLFTEEDGNDAAKVAVIGASVRRELFEDDADPVGQVIRIADVPFTVIGTLAPKGPSGSGRDQDDIIFMPIESAKQRLIGSAHTINREAVAYVLVKTRDAQSMSLVEGGIRRLLRQRHRLADDEGDDFQVNNPAAIMEAQHATTRTLNFLLAAVASVSLVVGGISIMNIMLVSVTERTREIGLRLAVGARRRDIRNQFLIEAITLCLAGGLLGIVAGGAAATLIAKLAGWPIFIGPEAVAVAVGFSAIVGVFFGFYPALKASRLDPIEALRFE